MPHTNEPIRTRRPDVDQAPTADHPRSCQELRRGRRRGRASDGYQRGSRTPRRTATPTTEASPVPPTARQPRADPPAHHRRQRDEEAEAEHMHYKITHEKMTPSLERRARGRETPQ